MDYNVSICRGAYQTSLLIAENCGGGRTCHDRHTYSSERGSCPSACEISSEVFCELYSHENKKEERYIQNQEKQNAKTQYTGSVLKSGV